jgi:hypothetical protein
MSNLVKPYEISVWDDVFVEGELVEKRLGVIGSDTMLTQARALEPVLTRNVNGVKTLTFKMYKKYIDTITGKETTNPFSDWLISERKVKLKYGKDSDNNDCWYDFIVKDVNENSSTYLYTYSLEDAIVQELSKNGFNVTLDAELMNNIGDAGELGARVLEETDWKVESEAFVQTIDEELVYITIPAGTAAKHIIDQRDNCLNEGIEVEDYVFE